MNIIIVGGGSKFGKFVAENLYLLGHNVYVLSHVDYGITDGFHMHANFKNITDVKNKFKNIIDKLTHVDMFLYVSNFDSGPHSSHHYTKHTKDNIQKMWIDTLTVNTIIPHELTLIALTKTTEDSKIVYMTSGLAENFDRGVDMFPSMAGYAGSKASLSHLMIAMAANNKELICALSPHFPEENELELQRKYQEAYECLLSLTSGDKGKIIRLY